MLGEQPVPPRARLARRALIRPAPRILRPVRPSLGIPIAIATALVALLWWFGTHDPFAAARRQVLDAIRMVESSDRPNPPDGDGGLAIGPYQIHRVYWLDAVEAEPALGGRYEDCRRRAYAERVIAAYMRRYVPDAWQRARAEVIARTHNGGPQGSRRDATLRYWHKVRDVLGGSGDA